MNMDLSVYMKAKATKSLGPFKRYALWVQGCNKRCPGCISPDAQPLDGGIVTNVADLAAEILSAPEIEGITISGGEPFLQQDALCELIDYVRDKRDIGVIVYTGLLYSEIERSALASRCDLIIDGEYIEVLNDDKSLRGSSNQNIICVSNRYRDVVESHYGRLGRKIEFVSRGDRLDMIGIPSKSTANVVLNHNQVSWKTEDRDERH